MKKKKTLHDIYFKYQNNYELKYGQNSIVLMEVGSFFEMYGIDNDDEKIGDLYNIGNLLNIIVTRRNKSILENNRTNCLMAGIPSVSLKKYLDVLIENNYTVILVEQMNPPKNTIREVTKIYSSTTYTENLKQDFENNLVSLYFEDSLCKNNEPSLLVGLSS